MSRLAIKLEIDDRVGPVPATRLSPRPSEDCDERVFCLFPRVADVQVEVHLIKCERVGQATDTRGQVIWCVGCWG